MIVLSVNTCTGKDYDSEEYRHQITLTAEMQQRLRSVCKSNPDEIRSGDILLMTLHGNPHLAVATENGIIDVQARAGVAERALPVHAEIVEALIPPELEE